MVNWHPLGTIWHPFKGAGMQYCTSHTVTFISIYSHTTAFRSSAFAHLASLALDESKSMSPRKHSMWVTWASASSLGLLRTASLPRWSVCKKVTNLVTDTDILCWNICMLYAWRHVSWCRLPAYHWRGWVDLAWAKLGADLCPSNSNSIWIRSNFSNCFIFCCKKLPQVPWQKNIQKPYKNPVKQWKTHMSNDFKSTFNWPAEVAPGAAPVALALELPTATTTTRNEATPKGRSTLVMAAAAFAIASRLKMFHFTNLEFWLFMEIL